MIAPTLASVIGDATARFERAGLPDAEIDAEFLFRGLSGLTRGEMLARGREAVAPELRARFEAGVARRERHEPLQYILGHAAFWRDDFVVTPAVLIPRPETEILVEAVAQRLGASASPGILDIGTGSGCLGLSILRELPAARLVALDISPQALEVARLNASRLGLDSRVDFRESDWVAALAGGETFDAIVSNPPYVARADESSLPRDVREFEPHLALFARDEDDLSSYRRIIETAGSHLRFGALIGFEVGMGQADRVRALLAGADFTALEILDDLAGIPRVVLGRRP